MRGLSGGRSSRIVTVYPISFMASLAQSFFVLITQVIKTARALSKGIFFYLFHRETLNLSICLDSGR